MRFLIPIFALYCLSSCDQSQDIKLPPPSPETTPNPSVPQGVIVPDGMVYIPATIYLRGNEKTFGNGSTYPEEAPVHRVSVGHFLIDETEVTNAQFKEFVDATGYETLAERGATKEDFPQAPPEMLVPGSNVFKAPDKQVQVRGAGAENQWWVFTPGANWKHPLGPGSSIKDLMDHPVVCLNNQDARAYAKWAGKRLPTEAEWEAAARGGLEEKIYTWGDEANPDGKWLANNFQGTFPNINTAEDQFAGTAPVKSFAPNNYGLYDMAGNVWEHVTDYYRPDTYQSMSQTEVNVNPKGPTKGITQIDLQQINMGRKPTPNPYSQMPLLLTTVTKGGSFLCHNSYCLRFRPAARSFSEPITPTNHVGFRCVKDVE